MRELNRMGSLTLLAVACLTIMVGCVIVPGLTSIAGELGVTGSESWLVTLPSLGVVLFGPLAGRYIERAGLHHALCAGLFLYGLFGAAGAFLSGHFAVFADRLLLGGATALVMAAGTGLISAFYHGEKRIQMIARQGMSIELGGVVFLFIGGVLAAAGWRWPFVLYLFAWLMLVQVLMFVPRPDDNTAKDSVLSEAKVKASAEVRLTWTAALSSMIVFFTAIVLLPLHFHAIGVTEAQTGYFLSFVSLVAVAGAWLMPRLVSRISEFSTLSVAFCFYALGHVIFAFAASIPAFALGGIALGLGFGFSVPLVNHLIVELSSPVTRVRYLARLSVMIFLGQFLAAFMNYFPGTLAGTFIFAAAIAIVTAALIRVRSIYQ